MKIKNQDVVIQTLKVMYIGVLSSSFGSNTGRMSQLIIDKFLYVQHSTCALLSR